METFSALLALCAGNSPVAVNFPHKGQGRGALMFSLICARMNDWVNNRDTGDLRRHRGHYDDNVMIEAETNDRYFADDILKCSSLSRQSASMSCILVVPQNPSAANFNPDPRKCIWDNWLKWICNHYNSKRNFGDSIWITWWLVCTVHFGGLMPLGVETPRHKRT